ncbi:MAG: ATP-binding protein [Clostridia bacterium]|nr:ATP-binding protein [Clostridia bacterium]
MKLIERNYYLDKLIRVIDTPDIKVITGVRRSGKSKLLEALQRYIIKNYDNANIIHINYNLKKFDKIATGDLLYDYVDKQFIDGKDNFILIDEIQKCKDFEETINSFHAEERFKIFITGSNAFLLSSDLATLFTGRTFEISIFPFSFREYMLYYNYDNKYNAFDKYFKEGGMAGSYLYQESEDKSSYIKEIYETLIIRDVVQKYKIRNKELLNKLSDYLLDNISNITSSTKIEKTLKSNKLKAEHKTITKYIEYLCNAFAFYKVRRYDIKGKKYLVSQDKYYLSDHSFRTAILGKKNMDYGRVLENIVAIELLRRGYEIYVGNLYNKEIDFVAMKKDEQFYIQVSENISDSKTMKREINLLLSIKDGYKKMIITKLNHESYLQDGIEIIDIADWLLNSD